MSTQMTYVNASRDGTARPIRFENLRPGSYYRIFSEPSRKIRKSNDQRIYWKSTCGFFSVHPVTQIGVVLMPHDLVVPMKQVPFAQAQKK